MKVGIVTFHGSHNYGAVLQAYALKKEIEIMNHVCRIINYKPDKVVEDYRIFNFKLAQGWRHQIKVVLNIFAYKTLKQRWDKFECFVENNFDLTKRYRTIKEVQEAKFDFDVLICGSDQVWNPQGRADDVYMLNFSNNKDVRKIAYAPSFGKGIIPNDRLNEYKENIDRIDCLSAREISGADIIKTLTQRDAKVVADPVFFHSKSDWNSFFDGKQIEEPYILCYFLYIPVDFQKTINYFKKQTGYKIILLADSFYTKISVDMKIKNAGPEDFINIFSRAEFVITSSFHGTAFSIIYRKPFISIEHINSDARVIDLLKKVNLFDRFVSVDNSTDFKWLNIDYDPVESLIEDFIYESREYLKSSLATTKK